MYNRDNARDVAPCSDDKTRGEVNQQIKVKSRQFLGLI